jgi:chorismate mutase
VIAKTSIKTTHGKSIKISIGFWLPAASRTAHNHRIRFGRLQMFHLRSNSNVFAARMTAIVTAMLLFAGCASLPRPAGELDAAMRALENARSAEAERDAPVEWRFAQETLQQAQTADAKSDYALAKRLSERAQVHADLARIKAQAAQARAEVKAREAENQALRDELNSARPKSQK